MSNLSEIEQSVSRLSEDQFEKFRLWFWEFDNEKWDARIKKDISENKLANLANEAIADYKKGKFKPL